MQTILGTNLQFPNRCMNIHNAEPTNNPVSKGRSHTIKSSKILCVKMKNGKESLCMRMHNNGEDAKLKCLGV